MIKTDIKTFEEAGEWKKYIRDIQHIKSKEDQERILDYIEEYGFCVVDAESAIIAKENLIARKKGKLGILIDDINDFLNNYGILGVGADLLFVKDKKTKEECETFLPRKLELKTAEIIDVEPLGVGYRSCIDTNQLMKSGEGILVGSNVNGFFLVHAETGESEFVNPRPFRVNAGDCSSYAIVPKGKDEGTSYLEELKHRSLVLKVNYKGKAETIRVNRNKIEKRPLVSIRAKIDDKIMSIMLQYAETVGLTTPKGELLFVNEIKENDKVVVHPEIRPTHTGIKVKKEYLLEK